jgi:DNA-binding MarR family transcriptional regulator
LTQASIVSTVTVMRRDAFFDAAGHGAARPVPTQPAPARPDRTPSVTASPAVLNFAPSGPAYAEPAPSQNAPAATGPSPDSDPLVAAPVPAVDRDVTAPAPAVDPEVTISAPRVDSPDIADIADPAEPVPVPWPPCEQVIGEIESALHSLARSLRQGRLHDFLLAEAHIDVDQAGLAVLYVLYMAQASLRLTDVSDRLHIDAPAVTRKAQQLERSGLVSRSRDGADARATRVQLTAQGRRTISRFMAARKTWLSQLLDGWPAGQQADLARLLCQFAGDVHQHLCDLDD